MLPALAQDVLPEARKGFEAGGNKGGERQRMAGSSVEVRAAAEAAVEGVGFRSVPASEGEEELAATGREDNDCSEEAGGGGAVWASMAGGIFLHI